MKKLTIAPPLDADIKYLAEYMCEADVNELLITSGVQQAELETALTDYFLESFICFSVIEVSTGTPIAMFGCVGKQMPNGVMVGYPWLLTDGSLFKYKRDVWTASKVWLKQFKEYFDVLQVVASDEHPYSIPYLKELGFKEYSKINIEGMKGDILVYV